MLFLSIKQSVVINPKCQSLNFAQTFSKFIAKSLPIWAITLPHQQHNIPYFSTHFHDLLHYTRILFQSVNVWTLLKLFRSFSILITKSANLGYIHSHISNNIPYFPTHFHDPLHTRILFQSECLNFAQTFSILFNTDSEVSKFGL